MNTEINTLRNKAYTRALENNDIRKIDKIIANIDKLTKETFWDMIRNLQKQYVQTIH